MAAVGQVTTKKEIIDHVVASAGHHATVGQHMGSNDLSTAGLVGQQNPLTDSYLQHGKQEAKYFRAIVVSSAPDPNQSLTASSMCAFLQVFDRTTVYCQYLQR